MEINSQSKGIKAMKRITQLAMNYADCLSLRRRMIYAWCELAYDYLMTGEFYSVPQRILRFAGMGDRQLRCVRECGPLYCERLGVWIYAELHGAVVHYVAIAAQCE